MFDEAIYKGATRPAMKLGVPLVPLVILIGVGMLLVMWGGILVSWWVALAVLAAVLPVLGWMRYITAELHIRQIHQEFEMDWEAEQASWGGTAPTKDQVAQMMARNKVQRHVSYKWGNCILAFTFRRRPEATFTMMSRIR